MLTRGYTLTSLLVSMSIGISLLGAGAAFALNLSKQQLAVSQTLELQNHVKRLGLLISTELRRAGYDGMAGARFISGTARDSSPFHPAFKLGVSDGHGPGSCVLFHYDKNHNGIIEAQPHSELLGFRLNNGAIEARVDGRDCSQSGWQDLTDPTYLKVEHFQISSVAASDAGALLSVRIEARLMRDPSVSARLYWPVTVRNY